MASSSNLVIRLVPDSPVDAATFATYLDDLQIAVYQADTDPVIQLGTTPDPNAVPRVILTPLPGVPNNYISSVLRQTSQETPKDSGNTYGQTLQFENTSGIAVGAYVFSAENNSLFNSGTQVTGIKETSVTLSQSIPQYLSARTICSFVYDYPSVTPPSLSLSPKTNAKANNGSSTLTFATNDTNGICYGMVVSGSSGIDGGTTVKEVNQDSVILTKPLIADVLKGTAVTFSYDGLFSGSGITQHVEEADIKTPFWSFPIYIPSSVATAVISLNLPSPMPLYLNITVEAQRKLGTTPPKKIPVDNDFYNVILYDSLPQYPYQYQNIPLEETALYITLPPPPITAAIDLTVPKDGTPPNFADLYAAIAHVLSLSPSDPGTAIAIASQPQDQAHYRLIAYEIIWSQRNTLPIPPDPLEHLYTNPPNPGSSSSNGNNNSDEQDRQKFEGTLSSFYATHNANAEHLTKFVSAAFAAVYCELKSIAATQALLEFPVDPPSPSSDPPPSSSSPSSWLWSTSQVYTELLIQGLSTASNTSFGVPAAFFYALGATMDKSTTPDRRYQIACGDTIERILQEIGNAVIANAILDTESFKSSSASSINAAQAARRLSALGISSASSSPSIVLLPNPKGLSSWQPLAQVVQAWLSQPSPSLLSLSPLSPPTYQIYQTYQTNVDDQIWATIATNDAVSALSNNEPQGYLNLVLAALTQGYVIPNTTPIATLADKITAFLQTLATPPGSSPTVETLKGVTETQWTSFFTTPTFNLLDPPKFSWLPTFIQVGPPPSNPKPGYITTCIKAFVRAVQKFFTVSSIPNNANPASPGSPSSFGLPPFDAIAQAVSIYQGSGTFVFGSGPLNDSAFT